MHTEARKFIESKVVRFEPDNVIEFGSRDINGSVRDLFKNHLGIDMMPGQGVDVVADARMYGEPSSFACVVCCELFEHSKDWSAIVKNAYRILRKGGMFLATCAGPDREPHSMFDGGALHEGEYYRNLDRESLEVEFKAAGFMTFTIDEREGQDLYIRAFK